GGSVLGSASDVTNFFTLSGRVSIGAVAVGASVAVLVIGKDTDAWIGDHATVEAQGNGASIPGVVTGMTDAGIAAVDNDYRGVVVQARSKEAFFVIALSASVGFFAGVGVVVSV